MKLVLFRPKGDVAAKLRVGALVPGGVSVADVTAAFADHGDAVSSMRVFLELGAAGFAMADKALGNELYHRKLENVDLRAPIYDP